MQEDEVDVTDQEQEIRSQTTNSDGPRLMAGRSLFQTERISVSDIIPGLSRQGWQFQVKVLRRSTELEGRRKHR